MLAEFESNGIVANNKYNGQEISVVGVINEIDYEWDNTPYVYIDSGSDWDIFGLDCVLQDVAEVSGLDVGLEITVVGMFVGMDLGDVRLNPCVVK